MPEKGYFPPKDADFNTYANQAAPYLDDNKARLGIDSVALTDLGTLMTQWNDIFPKSQNPTLRTSNITKDKNDLRIKLEDQFRLIYDDLPHSKLTNKDRDTLNIKRRDSKNTPMPVAGKGPGIEMKENIHLQQTLRFINPFDSETQELPIGQKIKLEMYIGQPGLKDEDIEFKTSYTVSRFLKKISFTEADMNKTTYYRARYVNSRGQEGPPSEIFTAVVT